MRTFDLDEFQVLEGFIEEYVTTRFSYFIILLAVSLKSVP
jgi:hypothetical protein